jgi:5-methylthioadenosine/S-adenosylhomocysteine deaminase
VLIEEATVVTVNPSDEIISPGWIAIRDGAIAEVSDRPIAVQPGEPRIAGRGRVVIPGLINAHTHLFQTLIRGRFDSLPFSPWLRSIYHCHAALSPEISQAAAVLASAESARAGVTMLLDHQFLNRGVELALSAQAGVAEVGLRSVVARTLMDLGELAPPGALESPTIGLREVERLVEAQRQMDRGDEMFTVMTGANTPGVSASGEMATAVREFAEDAHLRRSSHLAESTDVLDALERRSGRRDVVGWLEDIDALGGQLLAPHSVHVTPAEIELMAQREVVVVHNPISNMFLGDGIAPVAAFLGAGVKVTLGTDGAASNNSQDMFAVMKAAALLQRLAAGEPAAVSPAAVLRMATANAAAALGIDAGSIEAGKRADLVVLDLDGEAQTAGGHDVFSTIVYCAGPPNVRTVIVNGDLVFDAGQLVKTDEEALLARARSAADEMVAAL